MTAAIGFNNYVTQTGTAIVAGSQAANLPATNIAGQSGAPSTGWQTAAGVVTSAAGALLTITPIVPAQVWRSFGVFRTNLTPQATVTFSLFSGGVSIWSLAVTGLVGGYGQVVAMIPADTVGDYCTIAFDDPGNPSSFINVPLVYAGPMWMPATNPAWSTTFGWDDGTDLVTTRGGQEVVTLRWKRRRTELDLEGVRATEVFADIDQMRQIERFGVNILYIPDIAGANIQMEALFGRVTDTSDVAYPLQMADRRSWRGKLQERI
jgi:hypothetical protein